MRGFAVRAPEIAWTPGSPADNARWRPVQVLSGSAPGSCPFEPRPRVRGPVRL